MTAQEQRDFQKWLDRFDADRQVFEWQIRWSNLDMVPGR
jgi:hypothetical protein